MKNTALHLIQIILILALAGGIGYSQASGQAGSQPSTPSETAGVVDGSFNYQGVLKENGAPVTGERTMTFTLYTSGDCLSGPLQTLGPLTIAVNNGIFNIPLNYYSSQFNGQALYLQVIVNSLTLSCEPILPVPYALSLRPKSRVIGGVPSDATLYLENTDTGSNYADGLYAIAHGTKGSGVTGVSDSANGYGVRAVNSYGDALHAEGNIWSSQDSLLYLSPYNIILTLSPNTNEITYMNNGGVSIRQVGGIESIQYGSIPINMAGTLFGSPVFIKSIEVCYKTVGTNMSITSTQVVRRVDSGDTYDLYINDPTSRNNTSISCYTANASTPYKAINNSSYVQFTMSFGTLNTGFIYIYKVKLTLSESSS